jgi:adenosylcobyric acid synthase
MTWILALARAGTRILGLCGGYQMLGRHINDPEGSDGAAAGAPGLGLLNVETVMAANKTVSRSSGVSAAYGAAVEGYEIHMGRTSGPDTARPLLTLNGHGDGAISADGRIEGTYLHGLFGSDDFRHAWLAALGQSPSSLVFGAQVDDALDEIAAVLETTLDVETLLALAEAPGWSPTI